ncbi:uncharacterized protein [Rutidosis leptorrhynchoides]|uniref:uncharacterized protein n=1 Tax=Rutidosis leptorrhynchoides TaxID=125765 RepID=UPI003A999283
MSWVSWETILSSYDRGGFNFGTLRTKNWDLLGKWWWRLHNENNTYWVKVIKSIYGQDEGLGNSHEINIPNRNSIWQNIQRMGVVLSKWNISFSTSFVKSVSTGDETLLWKDIWLSNVSLCEKFNRIYRLDTNQEALVSERITKDGTSWTVNWRWSREPTGRTA